jgi:hypothetical protein
VFDQLKQTLLFTWPPLLPESAPLINLVQSIARDSTLKEFKSSCFDTPNRPIVTGEPSSITFYDEQPSLENIACTRHYYSKTKVEAVDQQTCNFQRILIPYGNISFEAFQVTPIMATKSMNAWPRYRLPSSDPKPAPGKPVSFQRDHARSLLDSNMATRAFASSTSIPSQLETQQRLQYENVPISSVSTSGPNSFQVRVGGKCTNRRMLSIALN